MATIIHATRPRALPLGSLTPLPLCPRILDSLGQRVRVQHERHQAHGLAGATRRHCVPRLRVLQLRAILCQY